MTSERDALLALADRVASGQSIMSLSKEIWSSVYPEPEKGPWYWRTRAWSQWNLRLWYFEAAIRRRDWFYVLGWLHRGVLPEMIYSEPAKAIAAILRAKAGE